MQALAARKSGMIHVILLGALFGLTLGVEVWLADATAPVFVNAVTLPDLREHTTGRILFNRHCGECHGVFATGTPKGPSLLDPPFRPADMTFERFSAAVTSGTKKVVSRFGPMPALVQVKPNEISHIHAFVEALQHANPQAQP